MQHMRCRRCPTAQPQALRGLPGLGRSPAHLIMSRKTGQVRTPQSIALLLQAQPLVASDAEEQLFAPKRHEIPPSRGFHSKRGLHDLRGCPRRTTGAHNGRHEGKNCSLETVCVRPLRRPRLLLDHARSTAAQIIFDTSDNVQRSNGVQLRTPDSDIPLVSTSFR